MRHVYSILLLVLPLVCLGQTSVPLYESIYNYRWMPNDHQWSSQWNERTIDFIYNWSSLVSRTHQTIQDLPFDYDQLENFSYDSNGQLMEHEIKEWTNGIWQPSKRFNYSYQIDGQQTQRLEQRWNGNAWVNYQRWIQTYSSEGLKTSFTKQSWLSAGPWKNFDLDSCFYNNLDQLVETRSYNWNDSIWYLSSHELFEYDSLGNLEGSLRQGYAFSSWENSGMTSYQYNSQQKVVHQQNWHWEGYWSTNRNTYWTYDTEGQVIEKSEIVGESQYVSWFSKFYYHESGILQSETFQNKYGDYVDSGDSTWYNFSISTKIDEKSIQPSIYPNPATDNLRIESQTPLAQVKLTDLAGRVALQETFRQAQGGVSIDVSTLPSGIYLLEAITQDGKRSVQKVVKR